MAYRTFLVRVEVRVAITKPSTLPNEATGRLTSEYILAEKVAKSRQEREA